MLEEWRPIPGWEGVYEVSDQGHVRSLDRVLEDGKRLRGKVLKPAPNTKGYLQVGLHGGEKCKCVSVHRLVLLAFVGEPEEGFQGCHYNGDQTDNRLENLRWDSVSGNNLDRVRHGTHHLANRTHCPRGHLLISENIYPSYIKRGMRSCKACGRVRDRVKYGTIPMELFQEEANKEFDKIMKEESSRLTTQRCGSR